ncbi:MAG: phage tail assembly protein [Humidesulfovibrio sp.]
MELPETTPKLPIKVKLTKPVKHGDSEVTELVFNRRVVSGDLRGVFLRKEMLWDELMVIAGRVAGYPPSVMDKLDFEDAAEISRVVMSFLMSGQEIGSEPAG